MDKKIDWKLTLGILGWFLIVLVWIWQTQRYFEKDDLVGGILHILVALTWTIFGFVSTKKYLNSK